MKLIIHPPVDDYRLGRIREAAGSMTVVNCQNPAEAVTEIADADAYFGKITPEMLAAAQRLQWVQSLTASLEHYLFPALIDHPCQLSNMRGLYSDIIADHVMGFIICIARNFHVYLRQQQSHSWLAVGGEKERVEISAGPGSRNSIDESHMHLADCTLGVVGVGNIGAEVCRRASAFGMKLLGVDPIARSVPGSLEEVWKLDRLPELLTNSDFVVIAAPHTPETEKMFRLPQFKQMKRTAWLINIGRGAIVDLKDVTEALQQKVIAGAAMDVFEIEPLPKDHPLWDMENVLITPHIAMSSPRIAERHLDTLLTNIRNFAAGKPPVTLVDKRKWF